MGAHAVHAALATPRVQQLIRAKARRIARHAGFRRSDRPDLEQELALHVLKQARRYDARRASVNTFIDRVVNSAVAMILRERSRLKRGAGIRVLSVDEALFRDEEGRRSLGDLLDERDGRRRRGADAPSERERADLAADTEAAIADMPSLHQEIARRLVDATETAIARELGISRRQVRNAVDAIRQRFDEVGLSEEFTFRGHLPSQRHK